MRNTKLLSTPLETWMIVPCDNDNHPVFKPEKDRLLAFNYSLIAIDQIEYTEILLWVEGFKKTIFKGFQVNSTGDDIINKNGLVVADIGEHVELRYKTIGELSHAMAVSLLELKLKSI